MDEAARDYAEDQDIGHESQPYDKKYYGAIADIEEFTEKHKRSTEVVLKKVGGRFSSIRSTDNVMWQPKSKVLSKEFMARFPKFAPSSQVK